MQFDDGDYEEDGETAEAEKIGYKSPPRQHQFQSGVSGNPSGRPKNQKLDLRETIIDMVHEEITIFENGTKTSITIKTALIKKAAELALKGDKASIQYLLNLLLNLDAEDKKKDDFFDFSF